MSAAQVLERNRAAGSRQIEFATFHVGDILLGIDIRRMDEINRQLDLTPVPNGPEFVRGVVNLRGEVVTVLDLRSILGLPAATLTPQNRNVVVRSGSEQVGLLVDRVADVVTARSDEIEPAPVNLDGVAGRFFQGVYKLEAGLLVLLDVDAVLSRDGGDDRDARGCDSAA